MDFDELSVHQGQIKWLVLQESINNGDDQSLLYVQFYLQ